LGVGSWGVGSWVMGDGSWEMGDGRWEMGDGRWEMGDGRWEMGRKLQMTKRTNYKMKGSGGAIGGWNGGMMEWWNDGMMGGGLYLCLVRVPFELGCLADEQDKDEEGEGREGIER
jgi:hypothetical protein